MKFTQYLAIRDNYYLLRGRYSRDRYERQMQILLINRGEEEEWPLPA
jgi:hypothetical protein